MNPKPVAKIDNLEKLRMEKLKLATFCTYQEKLIGLKIEYFRENHMQIIGETMLPYNKLQNHKVNNLLDSVNDIILNLLPGTLRDKYLPTLVMKLVQILMVRTFRKQRNKA